jgi:hypothetical protein
LLPVLVKKLKYQDAVIIRALPDGAMPHQDDLTTLRPHAV